MRNSPTGSRKRDLYDALTATRAATLRLLDQVPDAFLKKRVHDFYSPVGWHFGHIGMTEEYWVCGQALGRPPLNTHLSFLFANLPENSKDNRVHLPSRSEIVAYLSETRVRTLAALESADLTPDVPLLAEGYAWEFARQHECQHQETITEMLQLIHAAIGPGEVADSGGSLLLSQSEAEVTSMIALPGGTFTMGSDDSCGYDNEKQAHPVTLAPFTLDRAPVTARQWCVFIREGGYRRPELWTPDGWRWRQHEQATHPEYWQPVSGGNQFQYYGPRGLREIDPDEPVSAISWYEADAYARWADKRLPTEEEWEYAARYDSAATKSRRWPWGNEWKPVPSSESPLPVGRFPERASAFGLEDMAGSVWQWTASPFLPYPGFEAFPYDGYSKEHMDGRHFVCRGGSWATSGSIARSSFRNWYIPGYRQGFLGLRCAGLP